jgi:hypothetical protein
MNTLRTLLKSENIQYDGMFDVNDILKKCNDDYSFLHNNDISSIRDNVYQSLSSLPSISADKTKGLSIKLDGYHLIDDISHIRKGRYVRWININDSLCTLKHGGIVVDIKFLNNGTHILILNKYMNRNIQFRYDNVLLFEKLSIEEELILVASETAI